MLRSSVSSSVRTLRKKPRHEVHSADGHADAEDDAGERFLRVALTESEHQPADHDGDQTQTFSNRSGEGGLQDLNSLFPGVPVGRLAVWL